MNFPFQPQGASFNLTTAAASATTALPTGGDGKVARYLRVIATGACAIEFAGNAGITTTAATGIVLAPNVPEIICTAGQTHIAIIEITAAAVINFTPVELAVPR